MLEGKRLIATTRGVQAGVLCREALTAEVQASLKLAEGTCQVLSGGRMSSGLTPWVPYESLADFLEPRDRSKTIEGYPAPHTALVVVKKPAP